MVWLPETALARIRELEQRLNESVPGVVYTAALTRIAELERRLNESVPGVVYTAALTRIAELERRVDWQSDMLLRRGQSMPLPAVIEREQKPEPTLPSITESDIAKYEAIREEGRRLGLGPDEIREGVRAATGWDENDIARAIQNGNGQG
jgi:hypothetical protein